MPEGAPENVTLSGLARELGLAKSTVSRALNGYPDIAKETQERVRRAAQRSGYRASSVAQNLKRGRVNTIGVVLSDDGPDLANPFFMLFLRGLTSALDRNGFDLMLAAPRGGERWQMTYQRLIASRKVDGFVLTRTLSRDARVDYLRERGVPFVVHGRTANPSQIAWIDMDNRQAFYEATARLAAFGHRRIGYIGVDKRINFAVDRLAGHLAARDELGLEADPALLQPSGLQAAHGRAAAERLLGLGRPPTALLCVRDEVAIGAHGACVARGLRIGEDISIIGYDDAPHAALVDPPLTTFQQDSESAGHRVAEMAASLIAGGSARALQELRTPQLIVRGSDGPAGLSPEALRRRLDNTRRRMH